MSTEPPETFDVDRVRPAEARIDPTQPQPRDAGAQWPSPQFILGDFLSEFGATYPNHVARTLLDHFGSISAVLSASWWQLRRIVDHRTAGAIRASRKLMRTALIEDVSKGPVLYDRTAVFDLLKLELGSRCGERLIAVYVDSGLHLLRFERIVDGTPTGSPASVRKIIQIGLEVGAAGLLVVHNHPSGDATPSESDRRAMQQLAWIARELDMHLLDSWVVAGASVCSILR